MQRKDDETDEHNRVERTAERQSDEETDDDGQTLHEQNGQKIKSQTWREQHSGSGQTARHCSGRQEVDGQTDSLQFNKVKSNRRTIQEDF